MRTDKELEHAYHETGNAGHVGADGLRAVYELGLADAGDLIVLEMLPDERLDEGLKLIGAAKEAGHRLAARGLAKLVKADRFNDYFARTYRGAAVLEPL